MEKLFFICVVWVSMMLNSCRTVSDIDFDLNGIQFKMIAVEGGLFMMGATPGQGDDARENEKPAHKIAVDDFYIGETEVTQELWFAVMENNPSYFKNDEGNYPVENVSWNDVQEFLKKLNEITGEKFRLPHEMEWEYAARGGNKSSDKKYSGSDNADEVAWNSDNSGQSTHKVATKKPNELGIFDMSGNVWEWCADELLDGKCIERGGGWANDNSRLRVSFRDSDSSFYRNYNGGFRLLLKPLQK